MASRKTLYVDKRGRKEPGIYEDAEGWKYLRVRKGKWDSFIALDTQSITEAIKLRDARRTSKTASKLGLAIDPDDAAKQAAVTVGIVIARYVEDGYPDKKGNPRPAGKHRSAEEKYCKTLLAYFKREKAASLLAQDDLDQYRDHRVAQVAAGPRQGTGHRTVDLELNTLNNAFRWAVRKKLLRVNPIASRARYHTLKDATHCREFSVSNVDELHEAAGVLMSSKRSEVMGWQLLFEGLSGLRTEEILRFRLDATVGEPGHRNGGLLSVRRAKKSTSVNPTVSVNEGLEQVIAAHRIWHAVRYPLSPWFFPGRDRNALKPLYKSGLTKSLDRLFKTGRLKKKLTSHGGRAFYVLVRRSQNASDTQIAFEVNHVGGVKTLEQVYGLPPQQWIDGKAEPLSWVPKGAPAWTKIAKVDFSALAKPAAPATPVAPTAPVDLSFEI